MRKRDEESIPGDPDREFNRGIDLVPIVITGLRDIECGEDIRGENEQGRIGKMKTGTHSISRHH